MTVENRLAELDDALGDLPALSPETYLHAGRRARVRRRAASGVALASVALASVVGVSVTVPALLPGSGGSGDVAAPTPTPAPTPTYAPAQASVDRDELPPPPAADVEAVPGHRGVDTVTTTRIPGWAQEYGNHGPVAISPDGRLWIAPDAEVLQTVVDPLAGVEIDGEPVTQSFAVEASWNAPDDFGGDVAWVLIYRGAGGGTMGEMDQPGRWTRDFELWTDDVTARLQERPSVDERLVRLAGDGSGHLVAGAPGVRLVRQGEVSESLRAAEVRWEGRTWFVVVRPAGEPWYQAYEPEVSAPDFASFLDWAAEQYR